MPPDQINKEERERARAALAGARAPRPVKKVAVGDEVKLDLPPAEVAKRRETARASMEGYERRERRKMMEQRAAAEMETQKKLAADLAARRQAAEEAARAKARGEAERLAAEAAAKKRRLEQVARSEKMIEDIKHDPSITIKGVRTFKDDLAESLRRGGNISELTHGETIDEYGRSKIASPFDKQKLLVTLGIVGLVLAGGGVIIGAWYAVNRTAAPVTETTVKVVSLVPAETNKELYLTNKLPLELRQSIYQERLQAATTFNTPRAGGGPILNLYPTEALNVDANTGTALSKTQVDLTRFLAALDLALPVDFRVALGDKFMLGIYQAPTPAIFYLFNVLSYERAGSSLAKNDSALADSLFSPLLNNLDFSRALRDNGFKDEVINNIAVRTVRNNDNQVIMLYAFLDQHTLLMTENVEAFEKILGLFQTPLPSTQ